MDEQKSPAFPKWAPTVGAVFAAVTVLFLMILVIAGVIFDRTVPDEARFLVVSILALTVAAAAAFLGGDAAAKGKIPFPYFRDHPLQISTTGGIAAFLIVLFAGAKMYPSPDSSRYSPVAAEYCEFLSPLVTQLNRTKAAFQRWRDQNLYLEARIIREGNIAARNLLISKSHLVIPSLRPAAADLVEHYDRWLEEFDRIRGGTEPDLQTPFVFVGPEGYPFPAHAEASFVQRHAELAERFARRNPCR